MTGLAAVHINTINNKHFLNAFRHKTDGQRRVVQGVSVGSQEAHVEFRGPGVYQGCPRSQHLWKEQAKGKVEQMQALAQTRGAL